MRKRSGESRFGISLGKLFIRLYLKTHHKKGLVECLKVQALSLKTQKKKKKEECHDQDGAVIIFSVNCFLTQFLMYHIKSDPAVAA
jgi:hypothetical protein